MRLPDDALAEAAAWIAKLHGPDRSAQLETGLRRWLLEDPMHRAAFDRANELWMGTERIPKVQIPLRSLLPPETPRAWPQRLAIAGVAGIVAAVLVSYLHHPSIETAIGELRNVALEDSSRMALNTATRVQVRYDDDERRIELMQGEALFEVARDPHRPFIVTVGDKTITALGTSFVVRQDSKRLSVTLLDGKVAMEGEGSRVLAPGQRVTFMAGATPVVDTPDLAEVTDWLQGQARFDNTALDEAVAEMNRYSTVRLALDNALQRQNIRVTGIFRVGDMQNFADALCHNFSLTQKRERDRITLSARAGDD
jgi:transmembrane sensor